jgi:hypothetical protein
VVRKGKNAPEFITRLEGEQEVLTLLEHVNSSLNEKGSRKFLPFLTT